MPETPHNAEPRCGYRHIEHSADLAIELWAPSEAELLAQGARAIVDILTQGSPPASAADSTSLAERHVELSTLDREDRLVQWLNEIIFAAITAGFLTRSAAITLREHGLEAVLHGEAKAQGRITTELKSATYHDLHVTDGPQGWRAVVVIDI